jgi:hypothetical protein
VRLPFADTVPVTANSASTTIRLNKVIFFIRFSYS